MGDCTVSAASCFAYERLGQPNEQFLRPVRKRKKVRTLGPVDFRRGLRAWSVDARVEPVIRSLVIRLRKMHVEEVLDEEVRRWPVRALPGSSMGGRRVTQ